MRVVILFLFILFLSCNKEKKEDFFFNDNLYREVLNYQKKNPIPNNDLYKLFIYEINFSKKKDTLLTITVSPTGIISKNSFGIYKNKILKPSYIIDNKNFGKRFVKTYKKEGVESYILNEIPPHIDKIYPVYKYKIKRDKLILLDSLR
ncbi:hypothetical protein NK356_20755 [Chryseobacterium sp. S0630]|uniref:hypothetical protein n=1 Tax=Chryseobacterium sp. S0630 TaxID=2957803 RepID=UPI0020A01336|nr:hypothetical protein [Chryseobacterium sp. S0630]MCP1301611.1 hypothetical protein [Chryseobacterium sp. S0630]